jgi:hypothetical protein
MCMHLDHTIHFISAKLLTEAKLTLVIYQDDTHISGHYFSSTIASSAPRTRLLHTYKVHHLTRQRSSAFSRHYSSTDVCEACWEQINDSALLFVLSESLLARVIYQQLKASSVPLLVSYARTVAS